ncbi:hypothetical protein [Flavobacterium cerinum]|uniref:Uncharacterized protein n=1 Tax=Flavobacterium cerinum TaxID=2502784 RepID=A0ABY5IQ96_9FLAO|nr:hypothetical protein [Flavobacterium cerinum]UUC45013.1 hypothetical protein NOX80_15455 [Flavobacterium cerinum]
MNTKEHKLYMDELKALTTKLLESKEASKKIYKDAGIHTKSGNLTNHYTSDKIGYKTSKSKDK